MVLACTGNDSTAVASSENRIIFMLVSPQDQNRLPAAEGLPLPSGGNWHLDAIPE
jgi:hypothetical protein